MDILGIALEAVLRDARQRIVGKFVDLGDILYATHNAGVWSVSLHRVAYDWNEAARQARSLDWEDLAKALKTGRMSLAGTSVHSVT